MQLVGTDDESLAESAIGVHAEHLQLLAAIAESATAGKASTLFMYGSTEHRSPGLTFFTSEPTSSTSIPSSCPGIRG